MKLRRRTFLKGSGLAALFSAIPRSWAEALGYPRALQGPMIGSPGPNHFTVWVRASGAFEVKLEYSTDRDFKTVLQGSSAIANAGNDCCVTLRAAMLGDALRHAAGFGKIVGVQHEPQAWGIRRQF